MPSPVRVLAFLSLTLAAGMRAQTVTGDVRLQRADSLFLARDFRDAAAIYAKVSKETALDLRSRFRYGMSLAGTGDYAAAATILDEAAVNGGPAIVFNAGSVHARLGQADTAFAFLDRSIARGFSSPALFASDSNFARLRGDPRYAAAETRLRNAFTPCSNNSDSHRFDFWVGEWTVFNAAGQPAGSSSVQKILSDCVVFENWTDAQGGQGKSLNAFNSTLGRWQQFWTDQYGAVTEYRESEWVGPSLQYTAQGVTRQGAAVLQRMTFTPVDAATVRQHGESSTDGGKTWTTSYDLFYHRRR
jgi:hypothetical protein